MEVNEERKEILRLLAEGVIDVDGAEKLFKALEEGEKNRSRSDRGEGGRRGRYGSFGPGMIGGAEVFASIGEALAGIGPTVKEAVSSAICDIPDVISSAIPDEDMKEIEMAGNGFRIPEGSVVVIRSTGRRGRGGDLCVKGIEGDICTVDCTEENGVRAVGREGKYVLAWRAGDLDVGLANTVRKLDAFSTGGDIDIDGLAAKELSLKTMGGDLEMKEVRACFNARTMGGDLVIRLAPDWNCDSEAVTMGGDVTLEIPSGLSVNVEATTMGGDIECEPGIGDFRMLSRAPGQRASLKAGGEGAPFLRVKTMGGDIEMKAAK
jgi:hypothetical protein